MNHWYVQGRLGEEHRADLDREADRAALANAAHVGERVRERSGRVPHARSFDVRAWLQRRRHHSYVSVMTAWADRSHDR